MTDTAAIRKALGLTQAQLSRVMDLDALSISRIERGVKVPPVRFLRLLDAYEKGYRPDDWPRS